MKKLIFSLFMAFIATTALGASNTITYTATEKLPEVTDDWGFGLLTNAFNVAITSHEFSNGTGTITFAGEVTTIGEWAFNSCSGLTSITIPNSVTTIGESAFYYCTGLTSITIPNSVTMIGSYAFYLCSGLTKTNYTGTIADWCKIQFDSNNSNPMNYSHNFYINDVEVKDLVIPHSVTTIGNHAFYHCTGLTSVTIPNSVTTIGEDAFAYCSGLTSVTIPNSVTTIGYEAFFGCSGLTSIEIPNSVTTIGEGAFYECSGLTSVTIPNSVTTIGDYAFVSCSGLTSVTIGNSVTTIGYETFYGCSGLTSVTIPNSVTTIEDFAFYDCSGLISATIGNSVKTIGESAFENCTYLKTITLGKSLTDIGCNAFKGDFRIEEITSYAEVTPNVCSSTFDGLSKQYIYLYVPENSIRGYQVDPNWNGFDIRTKAADKKPIDGDNPIVTPSDQDVTITWPITDGTDTYTITITKNGETVCVLTFNAQGQLVNIAFKAPAADGAHQAPAATLTAQGYQFTVTGLNPGTAYNYSVTATDAGGKTLAEHKGNFSTTGGTGLESVHGSQPTMHKVLRDGQLLIETNNATYTPMGQKVK